MTPLSRLRPAAVGMALALLAAAGCGLKPSAADSLRQQNTLPGTTNVGGTGTGTGGGTSTGGATTGGATTGTGGLAGTTGGSGGFSGTTGGVATTGGSTTGSTTGGGAGSTSGGQGTTGATTGGGTGGLAAGSRIGISKSVIRLGLHAPQTGAAPVPLKAFKTGTKLFWENHKVFGHKVVVDFLDDQYSPSVARRVCEELSRKDFLVIGGAGTDQIQACATDPVLLRSNTPYVSEGVTTNGLTGLPNYFALTQTYAAQAPEVWTNANNVFPAQAKGKWVIMTTATPNFDDVTAAMAHVLTAHHITYKVVRTPKGGSSSDANAAIGAARKFGAKTIFADFAPNFWINLIQSAATSLYTPAWVGPGVTMGENLVANVICGEQPTVKASFLSPFPALDHQPAGFQAERNPPADKVPAERDLEMDVYGASELVYYQLLSVGSIKNLTRENFISHLSHFSASYGKQLTVYPSVHYGGTHFGGTGAWAEKLSCAKQEYVTVGNHYLTS
jgi:branched-chain amino acid transport system substrate-binding protein